MVVNLMARAELFDWRGVGEFANVRAEEKPCPNPTTLLTWLLYLLKANAQAEGQQAAPF